MRFLGVEFLWVALGRDVSWEGGEGGRSQPPDFCMPSLSAHGQRWIGTATLRNEICLSSPQSERTAQSEQQQGQILSE